jgi:hypothetical protein
MIPNPWVILGIVLTWVASLAAVGLWQRHDATAACEAKHLAQDNAALTAANATIERLNREARQTEQEHAATLAAIGATYAHEREDLEVRRRADVAAARDGALRLRIPSSSPAPSRSGAPEDTAPAAGSHDPAQGELPGAVAADLLALADDADIVATQLTSCQAVVLSYQPKGGDP